ncbi:MAG: PAS domain-containing protein [Leptolyngbyaceae cyanobacterium bins.59]|nr:PAS domain-containing protein [Leptolyngbyaceae cyanobacterium bins.59]
MTSPKRYTVLLIDDSPEERASYRRYLQRSTHHAFDVLEAESAAKGLEIYHTSHLDVILLDYLLSDMDGLELLHLLAQQEEKLSVPIIILTGQGDEVIATQVMKNGAQDYLVKGKLTADILCKSVAYTIQQFQLQQQLKQQEQQQQIVAEISLRIRQSLDLHEILQTAVDEVRQLLQTDRVIVFRFFPDWQGVVVVESCGADWTPILSTEICDPCFGRTYAEPFKQGFVTAKSDIYAAGIRECHIELLANFQVRANLVVPIMERDELWGLLIAHHCGAPRQWQDTEIDLLRQISSQLSIALQQAALLERLQAELAERKQAEIALREKEQQLQQLSDSMPQFVWISNAQGETEYVNRQWLEYSGLTVEQSRDPQKVAEFFHPEEAQVASEQWAIAQVTQQPLEVEARLKRACDGMYRWFLIRSVPILDEQGQVLRWYGTSTDIHDRKIAQLNEQFLNDLDLRLRQPSNADAMVWEAISRIGEYLNVERCVWHEVSVQEDLAIVTQDWRRDPNISSMVGVTRLSESILPDMITQFHAGQAAVVPDVATHPYTAPFAQNFAERDIRAFVGIPCLYEGRWVAVLAINARTVQEWRPDQVALLQDVVARLWSIIEHTRAAQVLQERERLFSTLAEALPVTIFRFDVNSHCTYINNYWTAMTGRTIDSVMGLGWLEALHPEDRDRLAGAWLEWSQNAQQRGLYQNEGRLVHLNGQDVWYYIRALPEVNDNGETVGYIGVMTDITERKRAEVALRESEERYRTLARNFPNGAVFLFDQDLRYVLAEGQGLAQVGLDRASLEGKTIWEVLDAETCRLLEPLYREALSGHAQTIEIPFGDRFYSIHCLPVFDDQGCVKLGMLMSQDITLQKQAEQVLRTARDELERQVQERTRELQAANVLLAQREREFRTLVENTPDVITRHDRQHRCLYINPACIQSLGMPPEFFVGKKPSELGYPEDLAQFWETSLAAVLSKGEMQIDEFIAMNGNEPRSYQVYVVPEREVDQSIVSVMTIGRDITQLRQAEQSTRTLAEELQRSNQELEQFAYVASHDLQEPLRAITSFTQLLAKEYRAQLDDDADMYIEFIVDGATRMQQLIRDLLTYSRVGRYELQFQPVDCNALLERVKNDLQVAIAENQAIITTDPLPTITADPNQMANLLRNLIGNSLKYRSESDPRIHISARRHRVESTNDLSHSGSSPLTMGSEEWLFSFQDNGIGIEPQYAERIFGIFQRLHTSDEYSGTGLGLAICQKIIERHQGRIWVESQLGQGATFFFTLPLSIKTYNDNSPPINQNPAR